MLQIWGTLHRSYNDQGPKWPAGLQGKPGPEHRVPPTPEHPVGDHTNKHNEPACIGSPECSSVQSHPQAPDQAEVQIGRRHYQQGCPRGQGHPGLSS